MQHRLMQFKLENYKELQIYTVIVSFRNLENRSSFHTVP